MFLGLAEPVVTTPRLTDKTLTLGPIAEVSCLHVSSEELKNKLPSFEWYEHKHIFGGRVTSVLSAILKAKASKSFLGLKSLTLSITGVWHYE